MKKSAIDNPFELIGLTLRQADRDYDFMECYPVVKRGRKTIIGIMSAGHSLAGDFDPEVAVFSGSLDCYIV